MHGSMTHQLAVEKNKRDDASLILRQANLQDCLVWAKEWFKSGTHAKHFFIKIHTTVRSWLMRALISVILRIMWVFADSTTACSTNL